MAVHRIHACSAPRRASVSRRFSLCRAFSFPFRSLRETDREFGREKGSEEEEKLPGNRVTRVAWNTCRYVRRWLKGVKGYRGGRRGRGRRKLREARIERVYIQWVGKEKWEKAGKVIKTEKGERGGEAEYENGRGGGKNREEDIYLKWNENWEISWTISRGQRGGRMKNMNWVINWWVMDNFGMKYRRWKKSK